MFYISQVHELAEQIGKKLARAEELGADGLVEESMKLMEEVRLLSDFSMVYVRFMLATRAFCEWGS